MTIVMLQTVSKAHFKAQALEYLRDVEKKKTPLIISHNGKPVIKVIPYSDEDLTKNLRGTVTYYKNPTAPVGEKDWEALR